MSELKGTVSSNPHRPTHEVQLSRSTSNVPPGRGNLRSGNGSRAVQHSGDGSTGTHLRTHRFHLQSPMSGHFDSPFFFHSLKSYVINTLTVKLLPVSSIITLGFFLKKGFAESNPVTSLPPDRLPHFTCSSTGCKSCSCTYQGKGIVTMLFLNYKCIE